MQADVGIHAYHAVHRESILDATRSHMGLVNTSLMFLAMATSSAIRARASARGYN